MPGSCMVDKEGYATIFELYREGSLTWQDVSTANFGPGDDPSATAVTTSVPTATSGFSIADNLPPGYVVPSSDYFAYRLRLYEK